MWILSPTVVRLTDLSRIMKSKFLLALIFTGLVAAPLFSFAVTISPAKVILKGDPGQTLSGQISLKNDEGSLKIFRPSIELFTEKEGTKIFLKDKSDLASWLSVASSTILQPDEKKYLPFTVTIPKNAPPGGHFAVMWWSGSSFPEKSNKEEVSIVTRAGILFYLTVSGDVRQTAEISDFATRLRQRFFLETPIVFETHVKNTGNDYLMPRGGIKLYNVFGMEAASLSVNDKGFQVLPNSTATLETEWSPLFALGIYRAEVSLAYGDKQDIITRSFWLLVLPWWALSVLLLLSILVFIFTVGIKKYNRWIIAKAQKK